MLYIHVYMYIKYIYIYLHICVCMIVYLYIHTHTHTRKCASICAFACAAKCSILQEYKCIYTVYTLHLCTNIMSARVHACAWVRARVLHVIYTDEHMRTHTHIQKHTKTGIAHNYRCVCLCHTPKYMYVCVCSYI